VGKRELDISLNQQAYFLGLTHNEVLKQIRQGFFGEEVQRLQVGSDEVKVWVRYPGAGRVSIGQLENMKVKNYQNNTEYPISELINYKIERGVSAIKHYRTTKAVTVDADVVDPYEEVPPIMEQVNTQIIPELLSMYPGVKIDLGGQSRESSRTQAEIGKYFGIAFLIIFIVIILAFKSFYQAVLVMLMIPLSWLGSVVGHGIQGIPVSLLSAWGLVALSGVIINDAVVFLDRFNRNLKEGQILFDAAYQAGIARFRPIVLTSLTTVLGLFPLLAEKSFQAQFLIPMAASIAYGVLIGTMIILLFFPVMILIFNDIRRSAKWLWTGEKPTAESVERVVIDMGKDHMFENGSGITQDSSKKEITV
jgi:multidrug efflux pump subunit AcrB